MDKHMRREGTVRVDEKAYSISGPLIDRAVKHIFESHWKAFLPSLLTRWLKLFGELRGVVDWSCCERRSTVRLFQLSVKWPSAFLPRKGLMERK